MGRDADPREAAVEKLADLVGQGTLWDRGDERLEALCQELEGHETVDEVSTKLWFIGRVYGAPLERGATEWDGSTAELYETVAGDLLASDLDQQLDELVETPTESSEAASDVVECHASLTELFRNRTGKGNRSLASKYLDFHKPAHFFMFDSRAMNALTQIVDLREVKEKRGDFRDDAADYDDEYARLFMTCLWVLDALEDQLDDPPSVRRIDHALWKLGGS